MSLYKVHFKWKDKDIELMAKSLDLTHPYFVSIKDIVFPNVDTLIINPAEDEVKKSFSQSNHLMIPFQTVTLIEEIEEDAVKKVMPFSIIEEKKETKS